ncbi:MAG: hypothetical protein LBC31_05600 [Treponema sp.]|jgi:hypothetical protein|nr:hypothetical protein [Treponema sp.]
MAAKSFSFFLSGIILCVCSVTLCAQTKPELRGFDERVFQYHFDRADRELDPASWIREARLGIGLARAGWERTALEVYADPELRAAALEEVERWSEAELEQRYAQWLFKRFFGGASGDTAKMLDAALDEANRRYAYHTDDEGRILYGETGDPEAVRPFEGRSVEEDRQLWRSHVSGAEAEELQRHSLSFASAFPELLLFIGEENRESFEEQFRELSAASLVRKKAEFEALLDREERLFIARRTGDVWSLRRQSENEKASVISSQLIADAQAVCAAGISALEERIEAAQAGTGDLSLAGSEWLNAFEEQFDRGLKAWSDAEERFIIRRMEWERDSGEHFLEGEEAWKTAFSELERERLAWEEQAKELFNSGERLFAAVSQQLEAAIAEAREEFLRDAALRTYNGAERAGAWVDMYVTGNAVMAEARDSVEFWLSRFVTGSPAEGLEKGTLASWVQQIVNRGGIITYREVKVKILGRTIEDRIEQFIPLTEMQKIAGRELLRWSALYTQYRNKSGEALAVLEQEFGAALGIDRGSLTAVLGSDSESFFLDEYQVELLRAKAIAGYWEQRLDIAQAVSAYAEELTAGRMTEEESLLQWRDSKARYDAAVTAYEEAQNRLTDAGSGLETVRAGLQNASAELAAAERSLEELNNRYADQMAAYQVNSGDFILEELGAYYASLVRLTENRLTNDTYYTSYLRAEQQYADAYILRDAWAVLKSIVEAAGETDTGTGDEADTETVNEAARETRRQQLAFLSAPSAADWYFAAAGKEGTEAERRALEEEGLLNRLKREALEETVPGNAGRLLAVYRDLSPYAPAAQREAADYARRALGMIFAEFGIESGEGELPSMALIGDALYQYETDSEMIPAAALASFLIRIDEETEVLPILLEAELGAWKDSLIAYMAAKTLYLGIEVPELTGGILDEYTRFIADALDRMNGGELSQELARQGAFYQYLIDFLVSYEDLKTAVQAEGEKGREHWRTYISAPVFNPYSINNKETLSAAEAGDPEAELPGASALRGALSREEGLLADAFEAAEESRRILTEAFGVFYESGVSPGQQDFLTAAETYMADPDLAWTDLPDNGNYAAALELFQEESIAFQNRFLYEETIKQQIAQLGFEYTILPPGGQEALDALKVLSGELEAARLAHQSILERYNAQAAQYITAGNNYEYLYGLVKDRFTAMEQAENEYEKQDAIRRWASTAYLHQTAELSEAVVSYKEPEEELRYAAERSGRAQIALSALQDLYNGGEYKRPYADEEYNSLYREYQESFSRMFLTFKAKTEFTAGLEAEQIKNRELYLSTHAAMSSFINQNMYSYYDEYNPPAVTDSSLLDFIHITGSGDLGLSFDPGSFVLHQTTPEEALALSEYFQTKGFTGDGESQMSAFETALKKWVARMAAYNLQDMNVYQTWGLALDYLTKRLKESNPSIGSTRSIYELTNMGADGTIELDGDSLNKLLDRYRNNRLPGIQQNAWNSLSAQQRADLGFLAALLLTGRGGEGAPGLTQVSEYLEMDWIYDEADYYKITKKLLFIRITVYRWPYTFDHSGLNQVFSASRNRRDAFYNSINANKSLFSSGISKTLSEITAYEKSCGRLAVLTKQKEDGITWEDIEPALKLLENIDTNEIRKLETYWHEMQEDHGAVYTDIAGALGSLYAWGEGLRNDAERDFENAYFTGEEARQDKQAEYRDALDEYIDGTGGLADLNNAARAAYGDEAAALKNHLENTGTTLMADLKSINAERPEYTEQYRNLAGQYVDLIGRVYEARFNAELAARETEWREQQKDLQEKLASWHEAAGLILERGRQDWKDGFESMQAAYVKWGRDFSEQYALVDTAWNTAYLESLTNKERWINQAVVSANEALDSTLLSFVASDAEAYARRLDSFIPSALPGYGTLEEAASILQAVLGRAGITGLSNAFTAMAGSAGTVMTQVRTGTSGLGLWNSGQAQAAAKELAWNSTSEMADGKMAILGFQAKESVLEAKKILEENIARSNTGFDGSMDELYMMNGGWRRAGGSYNKNIIVHSTFFSSAITDKVVIDAYRWFVMDYWELNTDLSEGNLNTLNYRGIQTLVAMAQKEIQEKSDEVFGADGTEGSFAAWIGTPAVMTNGGITDNGSGELGRLLREFYKWEQKQGEGIAAMNAPLWDKPLWDSRGSWFSAPSLRSAVDMINTVAATVVSAVLTPVTAGGSLALGIAINLADDLLFSSLDVAYGYKSWSEAGFDFGKKALMTTVSSVAGSAIKVGSTAAGIGGVASTTAKTALKTIGTSTITSAINAVTYSDGKFGWSKDAFKEGVRNGLVSAAVTGTSTFTSGLLNLGLEGFYGRYYADGTKLSSLAGGLAAQGVNYAFGGDFTLNAFNIGLLSENAAVDLGMLELHFGRDGFSAGFGTGGADVSMESIIGAARGLETWKVNFDIWGSDSADAQKYISQMRTLYSGGNGSENRELYDSMLAGTTRVYENRNADHTQTVYDPLSGYKLILLGNDALDDGSRFGLNVVFSHESYRNGMDDGAEGQRTETDRAVLGHISTALGLMGSYGGNVVGETMAKEANEFLTNYNDLVSDETSDMKKLEALAGIYSTLNNYDAGADLWKIRMYSDGTHDLVMDFDRQGNPIKTLSVDYYNATEDELKNMTLAQKKKALISTMTPSGQKANGSMTLAESLGKIIGPKYAREKLGFDLLDADLYDFSTLKDVLKFDDDRIKQLQRGGTLKNLNLTDLQMQKLIGNLFLGINGASWDGKKWNGLDDVSMRISDRALAGNLLAELNNSGYFDYYMVNAYVFRNTDSYKSEMNANSSADPYQGLDTIVYRKMDLNYQTLDSITISKYQTVDNYTLEDSDEPMKHPVYGNIQGNTVAPGSFNMQYYSESWFKNNVLVINNARTISGISINNSGRMNNDTAGARWLEHDAWKNGYSHPKLTLWSTGCFVTTPENQYKLLQTLNRWNLQRGYQIKTRLYEGQF